MTAEDNKIADNIGAALRRAVAMLKKREYGAAQMRAKLQARYGEESAAAAVDELQKRGLLSDARFARVYVRGKNKDGGQWARAHIADSLSRYGISPDVAAAAMAEEISENETTRAMSALRRKYPALTKAASAKDNDGNDAISAKGATTPASMARFLSARGFDEETIKDALRDICQLPDDI